MARLQLHDQLRVGELTEPQLNALSALLSAPTAFPRPSTPLAPFSCAPAPAAALPLVESHPPPPEQDPIMALLIEEDRRRVTRANIAHHRTVGTLTGRQHAMGLPVRGQRNRTNGRSAKRLNRIERRGFATFVVRPVVRCALTRSQHVELARVGRGEGPASVETLVNYQLAPHPTSDRAQSVSRHRRRWARFADGARGGCRVESLGDA